MICLLIPRVFSELFMLLLVYEYCCMFVVFLLYVVAFPVSSCTFQEGTGWVRFVSAPDFSKINRFGSVR